MIGIYDDSFIELLNEYLNPVQEKQRNIVCKCPFCEMNDHDKSHYHLWISTEVPMFHCFHSECNESGSISKLLKKLLGKDTSDKYVDKSKIKVKKSVKLGRIHDIINVQIPKIDIEAFPLKRMYVKKRIKFANINIALLKGLIFDVEKFVEINNLKLDDKQERMLPYLQTNFVGFLSEYNQTVVFRNIDSTSDFRYYKISIQDDIYSDFYKMYGNNPNSKDIVLAEGIFDILAEHIFDYTSLRNKTRMYAAILSTHYESLIKSIVFREQLFRPNIHILSDNGISLSYYKNLKKRNSHIINTMKVYYNKTGKDFNVTPIVPVEISI